MSTLGVNDLKQFAIPSGWDADYLSKHRLAEGTTYNQYINDVVQALNDASNAILNDPILGGMLYLTTEIGLEYNQGTSNAMEERTEYREADPRRGSTSGHMLPLKSYDFTLGWTFDMLRRARATQLDADISDAIIAVKDKLEIVALTRFFTTTYNSIASSGKDAPLVDGTTGDIDYTPPRMGQAFANSHSHFDRKGTSNHADAINAGMEHLREHGIYGVYDVIIPEVDISTYTALTGFVKPDRGVEYVTSSETDRTRTLADERYIGLFEGNTAVGRLWASPRVPTNYMGLYRSYGANNPQNPLAMRYSEDMGAGAVLLSGDHIRKYPLENAIIMHEYGIGVNGRRNTARLNGYCCYFNASGNYVDPSIS